jgi:hypothetical protein
MTSLEGSEKVQGFQGNVLRFPKKQFKKISKILNFTEMYYSFRVLFITARPPDNFKLPGTLEGFREIKKWQTKTGKRSINDLTDTVVLLQLSASF